MEEWTNGDHGKQHMDLYWKVHNLIPSVSIVTGTTTISNTDPDDRNN